MSARKDSVDKVMILGLDGATFDLMGSMVEKGLLPNFQRLLDEGAWGPLASTTPPFSATAWASFATGKNPGKHGIYDFWAQAPDRASRSPISSYSIKAPTLWQLLSKLGKRVGVINVPVSYPPQPVNGFMITGMLTPSEDVVYTYPRELKHELKEWAGDYLVNPFSAITQSKDFLERAIYWTEKRNWAHMQLRQREQPDLIVEVIQTTDPIQHFFWTFLDDNHPDSRHPDASRFREIAWGCYRQIDEIIGQWMAEVDERTLLLVMSDHGFGEATSWFNLNTFLHQHGFIFLRKDSVKPSLAHRLGLRQTNVLNLLRKLDVLNLRGKINNRLRKQFRERLDDMVAGEIDWNCTQAYAGSPSAEGIYLNVRGREAQGMVEIGEEYDHIRERIITLLRQARDPQTNRPIFEDVLRREDAYAGPYLDLAPDIILVISERPYIMDDRLSSPNLVDPIPFRAARGRHRPYGIFLAFGPHVISGVSIDDARIIDLAPTVLWALGLPVPSDMDGHPLTEIFIPDMAQRSVSYEEQGNDTQAADQIDVVYEKDEIQLIEDRLRNLGYLN